MSAATPPWYRKCAEVPSCDQKGLLLNKWDPGPGPLYLSEASLLLKARGHADWRVQCPGEQGLAPASTTDSSGCARYPPSPTVGAQEMSQLHVEDYFL